MDLQLVGKKALVVGSSSGIGAVIAGMLSKEGASVVVHGRDPARTHGVTAAITADGGKAKAVLGEVTTDAGAESVARAATAQFGEIDILVNVTGGTGDNTFTWDNTSSAQWLAQYELNTMSAVRMINHMMPAMKRRGWGRLIQIGSIASALPLPHQVPAYCASKAALPIIAVSLSKTLAGTGVTANTVMSGYVETPLLRQYAKDQPGNADRSWEDIAPEMVAALGISVGRLGLPSDLAAMVSFLASPLANWISGATFRVDGGQSGFVN